MTGEVAQAAGDGASGAPGAPGARPGSRTPFLDQYTVDLTAAARAGKLDPVLGRDAERRSTISFESPATCP